MCAPTELSCVSDGEHQSELATARVPAHAVDDESQTTLKVRNGGTRVLKIIPEPTHHVARLLNRLGVCRPCCGSSSCSRLWWHSDVTPDKIEAKRSETKVFRHVLC
jgi:hypothetical protein